MDHILRFQTLQEVHPKLQSVCIGGRRTKDLRRYLGVVRCRQGDEKGIADGAGDGSAQGDVHLKGVKAM